nr:hypothetical protein [Tanacetum cinerariifolium]
NIARFERGHYKSKQGCNKVDWVFDILPKSNWKPQSFNTKDCKVSNLGGQRILLDFKSIGGCVSTNCFGSKRFVEEGSKIDTDEAIDLAHGYFDDKSGEMDASVGEEPKSGIVTASETSPTSVLQSEGKHLDFRPKAGSEYIVCEKIVSTRKLKNGDEDDPKVDDMLSS